MAIRRSRERAAGLASSMLNSSDELSVRAAVTLAALSRLPD